MAEIKVERAEVVFRILYVGPESAPKLATLTALHDHLPADRVEAMSVLVAGHDRIVSFRHRPDGMRANGNLDVALDACAIPGKIVEGAALRLLLKSADAVVFVADESADGAESQSAYERLVMMLEAVGRTAGDLPLWMQVPAAAAPAEWAKKARGAWHPLVHTIGPGAEDALDVFLSCGRSVIEHFDGSPSMPAASAPAKEPSDRAAPAAKAPERPGTPTTFEEWERTVAHGRVLTSRTARELQMLEPAPPKRRPRAGFWPWLVGVTVVVAAVFAWWIARRL